MVVNTDSNKIVIDNTMNPINYGRKRIILNYDKVTPDNFMEVFDKALTIHESNRKDCEFLINMFLGKQNILNRPAPNTSNINNRTVVNYAFPITRQIVGYTFGNPLELIQKNNDKQKEVQQLSDIFGYEESYTTDICTALFASICGLGYEITLPSTEISKDNTPDVPIVIDYLDPRDTFIVQSTSVGNPQIMSCMLTKDVDGNFKKYIAFTNEYKFTLDYETNPRQLKVESNPIGLDPITMMGNSLFLTGDWEQAISVMDALNLVTSDSLNDIEGTIKSLLVLIGCELEDSDETLSSIKDKRLLSLAGGTDSVSSNLDAKFIAPKLDSTSVQNIREFLEDARNVITGIPDRSANSSGGDTGEAVLNRDGWTDIEIVAKLKELFFKKGKKRQVAVAIKILQQLDVIPKDLTTMDIDINIGRHTTDNLGTKASAFATLLATGEIATIDALEMAGLTTRASEVVERGEEFKAKKREESLEYMKKEAALTGAGVSNPDNDNKTNITNYNYNSGGNGSGYNRRRYKRRNGNYSNDMYN